jgi:RNA polymerase sigma factor (sigma-70 family)
VLAARRRSSPDGREALSYLCSAYWHPLYAYVRRRGYSIADAEDLTQEFFARLLEKDSIKTANRDRGRFRSFLLASIKHFLANEWDRANAKKRGGGLTHLSLQVDGANRTLEEDLARGLTAEQIFERQWALTTLEVVLGRLEGEFKRAGKSALFQGLKGHLTGSGTATTYSQLGEQFGLTEGAIKVTAHRMRQRFRGLLRAEIGETVLEADQIDDEVRYLMAVISS